MKTIVVSTRQWTLRVRSLKQCRQILIISINCNKNMSDLYKNIFIQSHEWSAQWYPLDNTNTFLISEYFITLKEIHVRCHPKTTLFVFTFLFRCGFPFKRRGFWWQRWKWWHWWQWLDPVLVGCSIVISLHVLIFLLLIIIILRKQKLLQLFCWIHIFELKMYKTMTVFTVSPLYCILQTYTPPTHFQKTITIYQATKYVWN